MASPPPVIPALPFELEEGMAWKIPGQAASGKQRKPGLPVYSLRIPSIPKAISISLGKNGWLYPNCGPLSVVVAVNPAR